MLDPRVPILGDGGPIVPDAGRIAVLRGGGLGDLMFALPALDSLRAAYPNAEIVVLGEPWAVAFLGERPGPVDRVIPLPVIPGVHESAGSAENPDDLDEFVAAVRAERFDVAVQIHGGGRHSNPLVRSFGARVAVGLRSPDAVALDRTVHYAYYQSEVMRDLEVVGLIGAPPVAIEPALAVTAADVAESEAAVASGRRPLAVLHPGAGDPRRRWPIESFAAVGDALADSGAEVVVTGAAPEAELTRATVDAMAARGQDIGGRLSLSGLAGLLSRSAVVVSNDSGPLHLARAVGARTVGIFWCGNLINAGPLGRADHRPVLSWRLHCPVCGVDCTRERCEHRESFVADAPVGEVRDAALDLLAATVARGSRSAPAAVGRGRAAVGRGRATGVAPRAPKVRPHAVVDR